MQAFSQASKQCGRDGGRCGLDIDASSADPRIGTLVAQSSQCSCVISTLHQAYCSFCGAPLWLQRRSGATRAAYAEVPDVLLVDVEGFNAASCSISRLDFFAETRYGHDAAWRDDAMLEPRTRNRRRFACRSRRLHRSIL
jgi:hypothetical protein